MLICYTPQLVLLFFTLTFGGGQPTVSLPQPYQNIGRSVSILEDKHNSLSFNEVIQSDIEGKFVRSNQAILNLGNTTSAFWIKIKYRNLGKQTAFLVVDVPNIEHLDFFSTNNQGGIVHIRTGTLALPNKDVLATNQYLFELPLTGAEGKGKNIYLRVRSDNLILLALKISDPKILFSSSTLKTGFESVYSGVLIMLFILNIFLYITVKDRTYLFYSFYIAMLFVYVVLYLRGYSYIFGTDIRMFVNRYPHIFASLATIAAFCFSWEFLGIKTRVPKMVPVYKIMVGLWIILLIVAIFGGKSTIALFVNYFTLVSCGVAWYAGICAYRQGLKPALYYLMAWFVVGLSFVIALLGVTNIIPYYDLSYEVGPIGTTIEMLFLSFALGDRFKHIRLEKDLIKKENLVLILSQNERLELLVKERTQKLSTANAEKNKLFSIIAHDLRSPFNSLVNILELNENDMLDFEELKMLLKETRKNVDHIHLTLNNLLYWAKAQMEMPGSNPDSFDLVEMVERLILVYQPLSMSKKVKLVAKVSGLCGVFADINEINLVFRNLIDNAIKFSPQNSVIDIAMCQMPKKVQVSVSNTALKSSMDELSLSNTEEFINKPRTSNEQGIGLGLQLCREYIESNGGTMLIEVNKGEVTISFSLPCSRAKLILATP